MGNSPSGEVCGCCIPEFEKITIGADAKTVRLERNEIYHFDMPITRENREELMKKEDGMNTLIEVDIHVDEGELKQAFMARKGRFPNGKKRSLWPQAGLKDQADPDGKLGRLQDAHGGMTFRMSAITTNEFEVADYYISLRAGIRAKCHVSAYIVREAIRKPETKQSAHSSMRASDLTQSSSDEKRGDIGIGLTSSSNYGPSTVRIRTESEPRSPVVVNGNYNTNNTSNGSQPPAAQLPPSVIVATPSPTAAVTTTPAVRQPGTIVIRTAAGLSFPMGGGTTYSSGMSNANATPLSPTAVPLRFADNVYDPYAATPASPARSTATASSSSSSPPPPSADTVFGPAPTVQAAVAPAPVAPVKTTVVSTFEYDKPGDDLEI